MSLVECNPNHCPSVIEMGKSLITQEIKIKELEQEKVELIEALEKSNSDVYILADRYPNDYNNNRAMNRYLLNNDILNKHKIKTS